MKNLVKDVISADKRKIGLICNGNFGFNSHKENQVLRMVVHRMLLVRKRMYLKKTVDSEKGASVMPLAEE